MPQGYFLDYIERKHGEGSVRALNASLRDETYDHAIFKQVTGHTVDKLWKRYKRWMAGEPEDDDDEKA